MQKHAHLGLGVRRGGLVQEEDLGHGIRGSLVHSGHQRLDGAPVPVALQPCSVWGVGKVGFGGGGGGGAQSPCLLGVG